LVYGPASCVVMLLVMVLTKAALPLNWELKREPIPLMTTWEPECCSACFVCCRAEAREKGYSEADLVCKLH
jgi:hypothetical protein